MQKIEPKYVTFDQAKWLKEKGFNVECEFFYKKDRYNKDFYLTSGIEYKSDKNCIWDWNMNGGQSGLLSKVIPYPNDDSALYYSAPEQWQIVEWAFQKYKYSIEAEMNIPESGENDGCYVFNGVIKGSEDYKLKIFYKSKDYPTKEKALSDTISHFLTII